MEDKTTGCSSQQPEDWEAVPELLPDRPKSFIEERLQTLFTLDFMGVPGQDYFTHVYPTGVCVVGIAPSHTFITAQNDADAKNKDTSPGCRLLHESTREAASSCVGAAQGEGSGPITSNGETGAEKGCGDEPGQRKSMRSVQFFPLSRLKAVNFDSGRDPAKRNGMKESGKKRNQGTILRPESVLCRIESHDGESVVIRSGIPGKLLELNQRLSENPALLVQRPCREGYIAVLYPSDAQLEEMQQKMVPASEYLKLKGLSPTDIS